MKRVFGIPALLALLLGGWASAWAGEETVALNVKMEGCSGCAFIVERALEKVSGVIDAEVSYRQQLAVVQFDNTKATVAELVAAPEAYGFPTEVAAN